jgi:hypothetical protein
MPRRKDSPREEFVCFERRELRAFFKGNHRYDSTLAAYGDHVSLFRLMLTSHCSVCCAAKKNCVPDKRRAVEE